MPYRTRLSSSPETLQDFELAAEDRYWDGVELATAGRSLGAICMMGYCAEMRLKLAWFRLEPVRVTAEIEPCLRTARSWMDKYCPLVDRESYHSLVYWAQLLRHKRRLYGCALAHQLDQELGRHVRRLSQLWWVSMRYRGDPPSVTEVNQAYDDVTWLRDHYLALWR
jgi:hypothetical protein